MEETHDTSKIPLRIKSGNFYDDYMVIITIAGEFRIPFEEIDYICLGYVEEDLISAEAPQTPIRATIGKMFFGKQNDTEERITPSKRNSTILDIYVKSQEAPYRFDSSSVNYKGFLKEIGYISKENFKSLIFELCIRTPSGFINDPLYHFLNMQPTKIKKYKTMYIFQEESFIGRKQADKPTVAETSFWNKDDSSV